VRAYSIRNNEGFFETSSLGLIAVEWADLKWVQIFSWTLSKKISNALCRESGK
jgi:hypothetical protein